MIIPWVSPSLNINILFLLWNLQIPLKYHGVVYTCANIFVKVVVLVLMNPDIIVKSGLLGTKLQQNISKNII